MSLVRRSIGATCRGHPRHRPLAALKCRCRASRRRLGVTRPWARARDRRLAPPERTSGRSALVRCPAGQMLLNHRDLCPSSRSLEKVGGAAGARPPALRWLRPPRLRLPAEVPVTGEFVRLGVDAKRAADGGAAAPRRLQSLLIRGGGAPNVHVSLVTGGGHGPTPTVAKAGVSAPERAGESVAAVEAVGRSGAAPDTAGPKCTAPETAGSKRTTPDQGSSERPVKRARVRSNI
jgi:hypothetical protein